MNGLPAPPAAASPPPIAGPRIPATYSGRYTRFRVAERRSAGTSLASMANTIAPVVATAAPSTTATTTSAASSGTTGIRTLATPPAISAAISTGRNPSWSPSQPAPGEAIAPTSDATPITSAIPVASPAPVPTRSSTRTGVYGRDIWLARNTTP